MNVKIDIHQNNKLEKKLRFIDEWKVPDSTKKEIREFIDKAKIGQVNEGKKLSDRTLSKYLTLLRTSLEILNKQTTKLTKEDIERFDEEITKKGFKSLPDYKINLKIFLKWKLGIDKTIKIAGWLDTKQKTKTPDYLKESEIELLYKNCKNASERFLISVLFCSGARIEEFLNLRYEDCELPDKNNNFAKITLKEEYSKTNGRTISLYWKYCLNAVKDYIDERIKEGVKSTDPLYNKNYDAIRMFLYRLGKKVLNKEVYPHLFRHSSATYYSTKLNRQELCYRYGWSFSSNMPDVYISRSGMESKQLDEKFKATEIEEIQRQLEKEKFDRTKEYDEIKKNQVDSIKIMESITNTITESILDMSEEQQVKLLPKLKKQLELIKSQHPKEK